MGGSDSAAALLTFPGATAGAREAGGRMRDGRLVLLVPYPGGVAADRLVLVLRRDGRLAARMSPVAITPDIVVDGVTTEHVFVRSRE